MTVFLDCHSSRSGKRTAPLPRVRHVIWCCRTLVIGVTEVLTQPKWQTGSLGAQLSSTSMDGHLLRLYWQLQPLHWRRTPEKSILRGPSTLASCCRIFWEDQCLFRFLKCSFTSLAQVKAFCCSSTPVYANSFWFSLKVDWVSLKFCHLNWKHCGREAFFLPI